MCGCGAHNAIVDCTCQCDHTYEWLVLYKERALVAESQLQGRSLRKNRKSREKQQNLIITENRETFDVKDRLAVFTYDSHWTGDTIRAFLEGLKPTADNLREAGAIAVLVLSSDVTVKTLDEHLLTELGLQRIPETP
jgi:hypothetical protein